MTKGNPRRRASKKRVAFQDEEETRYVKKNRKPNKPWLIEVRFPILYCGKDWSRWGAYETEEQRDQAFEALQKKSNHPTTRYRKAYKGEKE